MVRLTESCLRGVGSTERWLELDCAHLRRLTGTTVAPVGRHCSKGIAEWGRNRSVVGPQSVSHIYNAKIKNFRVGPEMKNPEESIPLWKVQCCAALNANGSVAKEVVI
jgi:hypothetical protein